MKKYDDSICALFPPPTKTLIGVALSGLTATSVKGLEAVILAVSPPIVPVYGTEYTLTLLFCITTATSSFLLHLQAVKFIFAGYFHC